MVKSTTLLLQNAPRSPPFEVYQKRKVQTVRSSEMRETQQNIFSLLCTDQRQLTENGKVNEDISQVWEFFFPSSSQNDTKAGHADTVKNKQTKQTTETISSEEGSSLLIRPFTESD